MLSIVDSQDREDQLETYRQWVSGEWGGEHSFDLPEGPLPLPAPRLAMLGDNLAGGISFTWHAAPDSSALGLWINTLYVEPSCRGQGIASTLIKEAEKVARATSDAKELLVYTDAAELYSKNGWTPVSQEREMCVLRKQL